MTPPYLILDFTEGSRTPEDLAIRRGWVELEGADCLYSPAPYKRDPVGLCDSQGFRLTIDLRMHNNPTKTLSNAVDEIYTAMPSVRWTNDKLHRSMTESIEWRVSLPAGLTALDRSSGGAKSCVDPGQEFAFCGLPSGVHVDGGIVESTFVPSRNLPPDGSYSDSKISTEDLFNSFHSLRGKARLRALSAAEESHLASIEEELDRRELEGSQGRLVLDKIDRDIKRLKVIAEIGKLLENLEN